MVGAQAGVGVDRVVPAQCQQGEDKNFRNYLLTETSKVFSSRGGCATL